ncbi:unnamed protein product [marine sediment metagenome]|uniref:FAD-binding domain-containing protein n=1 Tax=marine sediment metagenome TaxID=412755 RepID=X1EM04_9ZZZZ
MPAKKKIFASVGETEITRAIVDEFTKQFHEYVESDCLIVGGGPSGLMLGAEVAKKGKKVLIVERIDRFTPYKVPSPYEIKLEFYEAGSAEKAAKISGVNRLDDRTIQLNGDDLSLLWKRFTSKYQ